MHKYAYLYTTTNLWSNRIYKNEDNLKNNRMWFKKDLVQKNIFVQKKFIPKKNLVQNRFVMVAKKKDPNLGD